jgi:hypothetical protein
VTKKRAKADKNGHCFGGFLLADGSTATIGECNCKKAFLNAEFLSEFVNCITKAVKSVNFGASSSWKRKNWHTGCKDKVVWGKSSRRNLKDCPLAVFI